MLPITRQLSILVHLSNSDKEFADEEKDLILEIGKRNGLSQEEVEDIMSNPSGIPDLKNLPSDERFSYMVSIIQLMKVDGKVRQAEIEFCEIMAMKLGYRPGVVAEMSQFVYSDSKMMNMKKLEKIAKINLLNPEE